MTNADDPPVVRPAAGRPVHSSITEAHINALVDGFYDTIWADPRLGPIFALHIANRDAHLATMKRFWSSVLLKTGTYHGCPVPTHVKLIEVREGDFLIWLGLFRVACHRTFEPEPATLVINAAENIARSLWLAMFSTVDRLHPPWR